MRVFDPTPVTVLWRAQLSTTVHGTYVEEGMKAFSNEKGGRKGGQRAEGKRERGVGGRGRGGEGGGERGGGRGEGGEGGREGGRKS